MKRKQSPSHAVAQAAKNAIEPLESRVLLSTVASPVLDPIVLTNGTLLVQGTARGDVIKFARNLISPASLDVTVNKTTETFTLADVKVIRCYGFSGSDVITVDESNGPITTLGYYFGGNQNDSITGGSGADFIYGSAGNDLLQGKAGNDWIQGDLGDDRLLGGDGVDTLNGGLGKDLINSGAGRDKVINLDRDTVDTGLAGLATPSKKVRAENNMVIKRRGSRFRPADFNGTVTGYTPQQVRTAYGFGDLSDPTFTNRGAGQTIAIIGAYHYPTALADLNTFSSTFGLPAVSSKMFQTVYANRRVAPDVDAAWAGEAAMDIQWAHAIAPAAKIILVEADSALPFDVFTAINLAEKLLQPRGGVVSISFGIDEAVTGTAWESYFRNTVTGNISFVAAAGNTGGELSYPSTSPEVLSVGGTFLPLDAAGNRSGDETAWLDSGGGTSNVFDRPSYQNSLVVAGGIIGDARVVPDVAYNADPLSGYAVFNSTPNANGDTGWQAVGGTSAGTPQWAGIATLANERRVANGLSVFGGAQLNNHVYGIARRWYSSTFNDITIGSNTVNNATEGFDLATGWGTPKASALIDKLAISTSRSEPVLTTGRIGFNWLGDFIKPLGIGLNDVATVVFTGAGTCRISLNTCDLLFSQFAMANGDILDIVATGLQRIGNTIVGRGSGTALLNDGTPGSFVIQFEGRLSRVNGVDKVDGIFYAISRRGKIISQGQQSIVRGEFSTDMRFGS